MILPISNNSHSGGKVGNFCGDNEEQAVEYVHTYKVTRPGSGRWDTIQQAYGFVRLGHRGSTDFSLPEITKYSHENCTPNNNKATYSFLNYNFGNMTWDEMY